MNPSYYARELLFYSHHQITNIGVTTNSLGKPSFKFKPRFPFRHRLSLNHSTIVGSCNGLICLNIEYDSTLWNRNITLWNPSIHKVFKLPPPGDGEGYEVFGFGVNLMNGDFKVLRMVLEDNQFRKNYAPPLPPILVEVFSLKTGRWEEIDGNPVAPFYVLRRHVYVNGRCYWICWLEDNVKMIALLSFDMSNDVFREVSLPEQTPPSGSRLNVFPVTMSLMEKECLGLAVEGDMSMRIWVMKEYGVSESWTNIYTIDLVFISFFDIKDLIVSNGNILMMVLQYYHHIKLTCYDLATKSVSEFNISCQGLHKYMETLVSLDPHFKI